MTEKLRILVTGGAGYIGSHVVKELCHLGHDVKVYDNLSLGHKENVDSRAELIIGDIHNISKLNEVFQAGIDAVFHFAAWKAAGESMIDPMKYSKNNIIGSINLLDIIVANKVKYIVFSSTAAVYGAPKYIPVDEKHPLNPENYYGYTKLVIEENLNWYSKLKDIKYAALRYFNATGYDINGEIRGKEKNPANLSPIIMEAACGYRRSIQVYGNDYETRDGTCIRDYIHVKDLAIAHIQAMNYIITKKQNLVVNLGTGTGTTVLEMIKSAEKITEKKINYEFTGRRKGDPSELVASSDLAKKLLGWEAKYSDTTTIFESMNNIYNSTKE